MLLLIFKREKYKNLTCETKFNFFEKMFHIYYFLWYNTYVKQNLNNQTKIFHIKEDIHE